MSQSLFDLVRARLPAEPAAKTFIETADGHRHSYADLEARSGAYAAMWAPTGALAGRTAAVRVLHERTADGEPRRSVVSHFNKATKGRIVRDLLESGATPRTPTQLADVLARAGWTVEASAPTRRGTALDVVVTQL